MQNEVILCIFPGNFQAPTADYAPREYYSDFCECHRCPRLEDCVKKVVASGNRFQARRMMELLGEEGREGELCDMLRKIPK